MNTIRLFARDRRAGTAVQYAILAGIMALAVITGATHLGHQVQNTITTASTAMQPPAPSGEIRIVILGEQA